MTKQKAKRLRGMNKTKTIKNKVMRTKMNFGEAIELLKQGKKVARDAWYDCIIWLKPGVMIQSDWCKDPILKSIVDNNGGSMDAMPTLCMASSGFVFTGWALEVSDMLADDWVEVE